MVKKVSTILGWFLSLVNEKSAQISCKIVFVRCFADNCVELVLQQPFKAEQSLVYLCAISLEAKSRSAVK